MIGRFLVQKEMVLENREEQGHQTAKMVLENRETARAPNSQNGFGKQRNSKGTKQPKKIGKQGNSKGTKQPKLFWKTGKQQRAPNSQGFSPVLKAGGWTPPTRWRKGNRKFHLCRHSPLHIESQGTKHFHLLKQDFSIWRPLFVHLILHCCFKEAKIK